MSYLYKYIVTLVLITASAFALAAQTEDIGEIFPTGPQQQPVSQEQWAPPSNEVVPTTSITIQCETSRHKGKFFRITTGTARGRCEPILNSVAPRVIVAGMCEDSSNSARFSCNTACSLTTGNGDCGQILDPFAP